jgi:hypothetical protein
MPIPLVVWGIGIGVTTVTGFMFTITAGRRMKKAKERYKQKRVSYDRFIKQYEKKHKKTSLLFDELGLLKLKTFEILGKAVTFLEKAKLKERDILEKCRISKQEMIQWKKASLNAVDVLGGIATSALSGVATASAAYSLVGILGTASTGTAISTLSGIAATNATLAWLGGGTIAAGGGGIAAGSVIFGGLVTGPAILAIGFAASIKAGKIENKVELHITEMETDKAQKKKIIAKLRIIDKRVDELSNSIKKIQLDLLKLITEGNPSNDKDAYMVAQTAKSLANILEAKVIDESGVLVEE